MPVVTLPDGSQRTFDAPVTVFDVAADIGAGLAKAALAGVVDGREVDTSHVIEDDTTLSILTDRDEAAIEIIRHSTAHLLAQAVQQLFPGTQVTIGPTVEDGFYYDFASGHNFTPEDLENIEKRMAEIAADDLTVERIVSPRDKAIEIFRNMGEHYKVQIIEDLPGDEEITIYKQGEWMDLCRGPHVPSTGKLQAFKLTKVAGAYWRGDANNQQLQRIYGTAWANKKQLKAYLNRIAEAEKRDHRKIGLKSLSFFIPRRKRRAWCSGIHAGWTLFRQLLEYMRGRQEAAGYVEINTPDVMDIGLWETSGHAGQIIEGMFRPQAEERRVMH